MSMPSAPADVVGIGNALVDVLSHQDDAFLTEHDLVKGSMALVDAAHARDLYDHMAPATEISGGSVANTMVGIASFGGHAAFVGRIRDDELGDVFAHDIRAAGVHFDTEPASSGPPTGRCLIVVTPDAERTLTTSLGAAAEIGPDDVSPDVIAAAQITYLEGYLFDQPVAKEAFRYAARTAHEAGSRVALTLSDAFCVDRHRVDFLALVEHEVDILFANESEICALYEVDDFDSALERVVHHCEIAALTHGAKGSVVIRADELHEVDAHPVNGSVVDTTGAGDQYAAGFLYGLTSGYDLQRCGRLGSLAASEVISHLGARPEASLAELDRAIADLVERAGTDSENADLVFELIASSLRLARDRADRGDLKIANAALKEMRSTFHVFEPYRAGFKVAMFGSARTHIDDPLYDQARRFAAAIAERDWMVITGAGPGIMEAGIEGAGPDRAFGVSIRLPFETATSQLVAGDPKLINYRYFFTRKLAFIKEADGFVLLPGGFGTLDEAFELLTLVQTGKAQPGPIVLLDVPGGTYWIDWRRFVEQELLARNYVSEHDLDMVLITDDVDAAVEEIVGFYANYHSQRFVDGRLVLRMRRAPDDAGLEVLSDEFSDVIARGRIERVAASPAEITDEDHLDLERVALWFDRHGWARLRMLINRLNAHAPPS